MAEEFCPVTRISALICAQSLPANTRGILKLTCMHAENRTDVLKRFWPLMRVYLRHRLLSECLHPAHPPASPIPSPRSRPHVLKYLSCLLCSFLCHTHLVEAHDGRAKWRQHLGDGLDAKIKIKTSAYSQLLSRSLAQVTSLFLTSAVDWPCWFVKRLTLSCTIRTLGMVLLRSDVVMPHAEVR